MLKPSLRLEKIWEDDYFFELNLSFISPHCHSNLNFYTTNEELDELRQGLLILSNFKQNEFIWVSGEDVEKVTHYVVTARIKMNNIADRKMNTSTKA